MNDHRVEAFLERIAAVDRIAPLSDAKLAVVGMIQHTVIIEEADAVVAIGVMASHRQGDGTERWAVETVLDPGLRFDAFEDHLLASAIDLVPASDELSVWSHRHSLDAALGRAGFIINRELAYLTVELPLAGDHVAASTRAFDPADTAGVVALNRAAFASHREAASLDGAEISRLLNQEGMDPSRFLVAQDDGEIVGFCWTRIHGDGDGEIYRIAVAPTHQGRGLGRSLVVAGFNHLAGDDQVVRGSLWVDTANLPAIEIYRSLGMLTERTNREYQRLIDV